MGSAHRSYHPGSDLRDSSSKRWQAKGASTPPRPVPLDVCTQCFVAVRFAQFAAFLLAFLRFKKYPSPPACTTKRFCVELPRIQFFIFLSKRGAIQPVLASLARVVALMAFNERARGGGGRKLNIVVEGCCHGELPKIYASVLKMEQVFFVKFRVIMQILNGDGSACSVRPPPSTLRPKGGAVCPRLWSGLV